MRRMKYRAMGLFQWAGKRRENLKAFAKDMTGDEKNWKDIVVQCEFVMKEYESPSDSGWLTFRLGYPGEEILVGTQGNFENTKEPSEAALIWAASFERCVENGVKVEEKIVYEIQERELRIQYAREIYGEFADRED